MYLQQYFCCKYGPETTATDQPPDRLRHTTQNKLRTVAANTDTRRAFIEYQYISSSCRETMSVAKGVSESLRSPVGRGMLHFFTESVWQVKCGVISRSCCCSCHCSTFAGSAVVVVTNLGTRVELSLFAHEKSACCSLPTPVH